MPRNVEIKAKIKDYDAFISKADKLSDAEKVILNQTDTFFNTPNGRLKLRCFENSNKRAQLIFYERSDKSGPKLSNYSVASVDNPQEISDTLACAYGIKGEVKKKRTLFKCGQTRIHVDEVTGLGSFMELEVEMKENQPVEEGNIIANKLMTKLNIADEDLITCAYIDLLLQKHEVN